ncbi:glycosyltransferase [Desulfofundulus sp.]|uniref:glycosyltransferase n=1 Tax=Desulfofundulus sp. TaxID=2282750 RepID=UPI003C764336
MESKILFFIPTLEVGGAERVCVNYLNNLQNYRPLLALQFKRGSLLRELKLNVPIFTTVDRVNENLKNEAINAKQWKKKGQGFLSQLFLAKFMFILSQAYQLKEIAQKNDCKAVVSFITMPNIIALIAKTVFNCHFKVIINVHDVTSRILEYSNLQAQERIILRWLIHLFYPKADAIVAVAEGIKKDLIENFGLPAKKINVLYNPIDLQTIRNQAAESVNHHWFNDPTKAIIVAVGRLVKLKGFDVLIRAFANISPQMDVRLIIIGDGEERPALQHLIDQLGLNERIVILGFQDNPWKYMARADLFVLSSLTEGLPNVIGEAMALGLPIIATDCSAGIREYINDDKVGLLVSPGDPKALASGILRLLTNEQLRKELSRRSVERATYFDLSPAVQRYESLLQTVIREGV